MNILSRQSVIVSPDTHHYKLLKLIEANPAIQQREMAKAMGVSLGKANYCLKALVQKGLVKMDNFRRADNKLAYSYLLTPRGIEEKTRLTVSFLKHKIAEYEAIRKEIEELRRDVERNPAI
jgi:EPS-associated MarR family transcriptional regulator